MTKQNSSISTVEFKNNLIYGLWDGTVRIMSKEESSRIDLNSPATAICSTEDAVYIGTAHGDVWDIRNKKVAKILKANGSIKHTNISLEAVVGIHKYKDSSIIVIYIFGEISIYDTNAHKISKTVKIDGKVSNSYLEEEKLVYIVDGKVVEIYDIKLDRITKIKSLLSNTAIDQIMFMQNTEQNTIVYSTPVGKVCVDYANRAGTGFVFKAHKTETENREVYYPVTLMKAISATRILTGGGDGNVYLWDVKEKTKIQTVISTGKCILMGDIKYDENRQPAVLILILSERIESLCEIDGLTEIMEVPLAKHL
ncbi:hypothetical protein NEMIN01_1565 [Nematocida minor]|uniref:uncharacterized protein n=1 Tax=Nematocida minor TaxID=1912983 RepID=UPI00221EC368|nr:uncharacterized protein NEMIN01_1565 [Nematocida minor]KAI5191539.1 hypothetical protein NEMIN01_1565 [Nematocida minor]